MSGRRADIARIERWFADALRAVDPAVAVARHLSFDGNAVVIDGHRISVPGRVVVVAVGKAAVPMALAAERALGDRVADGIALTKDGHADGERPSRIRIAEAAHPIPDERGVAATRSMLDLLGGLTGDDLAIALISGGGSALLEAPQEGVTLADIAATTGLLLKAGAPIQDLNAVRIPLSRVKGGGLRRAAGEAHFATLILSDVLGNDLRVIASGPTVFGTPSGPAALAIIDRYGLRASVPPAVIAALERVAPPADGDRFRADVVRLVADNEVAVEALAASARADGESAGIIWCNATGEARQRAIEWVEACAAASPATDVLLGGGELTVIVHGDGVGGRNTEFALAAALQLERRGMDGWMIASLSTDGQDGPTGAAGAVADAATPGLARAAGVDPETALARNDSLAVFAATAGLVQTGPTGTNVCDLYVALRRTLRIA